MFCAVQSETVGRQVCCVQCCLRHGDTSPNLYNDVILPSVLTKI